MENVKEFMEVLMEVKISLAELNGKVDSLTDMKADLEEVKKTSNETHYRSVENEKDIAYLRKKIADKASKDDVDRIVEEKDNWKKTLPSWVAIAVSAIAFLFGVFQYIN